jgi:thiol-disulfide isomerase/thioredoxin
VRRLPTALALCLALCLVLTSCAGEQDTGQQPEQGSVDVDTPALRALRSQARLEPCRPTGAVQAAQGGLPEVTLPCLGGGSSVALAGLRGPMVVNLWAQWCGPCRTELPFYERLHRVGRGTVRVLGIDYLDTQPGRALQLAARSGVTFPLLADPDGRLRRDLKVRGLPGIVFVDAAGRVSTVEFRSFGSYAELRDLVEQRLDVTLPA